MLILVGIEDGRAEELAGKILLLLTVPLGQQFLLGTLLFVETLDGLDDEGVDNLLVVVPIEALVLEDRLQVFVHLDKGLVKLAPQLTIELVVVLLTVHVLLIDVALLDLLKELSDEDVGIVPRQFLGAQEIIELFVLCELQGEAVIDEFG